MKGGQSSTREEVVLRCFEGRGEDEEEEEEVEESDSESEVDEVPSRLSEGIQGVYQLEVKER